MGTVDRKDLADRFAELRHNMTEFSESEMDEVINALRAQDVADERDTLRVALGEMTENWTGKSRLCDQLQKSLTETNTHIFTLLRLLGRMV